jgi:hypothetical protein
MAGSRADRSNGSGHATGGGGRRLNKIRFRVIVRPQAGASNGYGRIKKDKKNKDDVTNQYTLAPFGCDRLLRHPFGLQLAQRCAMEMFCVCHLFAILLYNSLILIVYQM